MITWNIDNILSLVAFPFVKWSLGKNRAGHPFVFSVLAGQNKQKIEVICVRIMLVLILIVYS